jgi:hypothetical protein
MKHSLSLNFDAFTLNGVESEHQLLHQPFDEEAAGFNISSS